MTKTVEETANDVLSTLGHAVIELNTMLPEILEDCTDPEARDMAEVLWFVRNAREALQSVERSLESETARAMVGDNAETATLRVERTRRADRKAWDHDAWKTEVRRKAIQKAGLKGAHVITSDGEESPVGLEEVIRQVQDAHGSTAPRTTALRGLGIDPDDYCERTPGAWSVKVTRMVDEGAGG